MTRITVKAGPKFIAAVKAEIEAKKERHKKIFAQIKNRFPAEKVG